MGGGAPWPCPKTWTGVEEVVFDGVFLGTCIMAEQPRFRAVACGPWEKEASGQTHPHCLVSGF